MRRYIEELKKRPDHHRQRFALGVSGGITAIIFVVWVSVVVPTRGAQTFVVREEVKEKDSPISVLSQGVAQVYTAMKESFDDVSDSSLDLKTEYERMKGQVENGEIEFIPTGSEITR